MRQSPTTGQKIGAYVMFFISMAIFIGLVIIGFLILSWLMIIGAAVGLVIFVIAYVRTRFLHKRPPPNQPPGSLHKRRGNIYDHDGSK